MPKLEIHGDHWHVSPHASPSDPFGLVHQQQFCRDNPDSLIAREHQPSDLRKISVRWNKMPLSQVELGTTDPMMFLHLFGELRDWLNTQHLSGELQQNRGQSPDRTVVLCRDVNDRLHKLEQDWPAHGNFLTLDRDGCNDLIRAVRKARDDAFGKDQ